MLRDRATVRNANFHSPAVRTPLKTPGSSSRMRRTPTARRAGVHGVLGMSASFSRKGRLPYSPARAEGGAQSDGEEEVLDEPDMNLAANLTVDLTGGLTVDLTVDLTRTTPDLPSTLPPTYQPYQLTLNLFSIPQFPTLRHQVLERRAVPRCARFRPCRRRRGSAMSHSSSGAGSSGGGGSGGGGGGRQVLCFDDEDDVAHVLSKPQVIAARPSRPERHEASRARRYHRHVGRNRQVARGARPAACDRAQGACAHGRRAPEGVFTRTLNGTCSPAGTLPRACPQEGINDDGTLPLHPILTQAARLAERRATG